MSDTPKSPSAPYGPYATFKARILSLGQPELPPRIDASVLSTMSGGAQSEFMGTLRFLSLVNGNGEPTKDAQDLVADGEEGWPDQLRALLEQAFPDDVLTALRTGTPAQYQESIRSIATNSTVIKAARFLFQAARDVGLPISSHIPRPPGSGPKKPRTPRKQAERSTAEQAVPKQPRAQTATPVDAELTSEIRYPFPLRESVTVWISGLPRDLSMDEAKRLAAFIRTLAHDFDTE